MTKHQEGISLVPTRFAQEEIPISVATVLVDGKRLTQAIYKQITEFDLIDDETGAMRGNPLGSFHLHSKTCPEQQHTHVLWERETELHLATIVAPESDERYRRKEEVSSRRQDDLMCLLALLLVLADHPFTVTAHRLQEREVAIAGYTLYVDEQTANHLQRLQWAREQVAQDRQAWQARTEAGASSQLRTFGEQERNGAAAIVAQLDQQGIELKHPAQNRIDGPELRYGLSVYYGDDALSPPSGPKSWCRYPVSLEGSSAEDPLFFWRAKDPQQRWHQQACLSQAVEVLLSEEAAWRVRVLLAELLLGTQRESARKLAETILTGSTGIAALLEAKSAGRTTEKKRGRSITLTNLDPEQAWKSYKREVERFEALEHQWKTQVKQLFTLRQLFLLS